MNEYTQFMNTTHVIPRPRLLKKLDQIRETKLTQIIAPVGFGKTTLAKQLVEHTALPAAWYTITERDRDVGSLHNAVVQSLIRNLGGSQIVQETISSSPTQLAAQFVDLVRNLNSEILLMLDDVHNLDSAIYAEAWLRSVIDNLPSHCRMILISRTRPNLEGIEFDIQHKSVAVEANDLQLSLDEVRVLAETLGSQVIEQEGYRDIWTQLDGWVMGTCKVEKPHPR